MRNAECGISVFLLLVENGAGVNKMTNMTYAQEPDRHLWQPGLLLGIFG